jgi:hypothetical protein
MANQKFSFYEIVVLVRVAIKERKSAADLNHPSFPPSEASVVVATEVFEWVEKAKGKFDGYEYSHIDSIIDVLRKLSELETSYTSGLDRIL